MLHDVAVVHRNTFAQPTWTHPVPSSLLSTAIHGGPMAVLCSAAVWTSSCAKLLRCAFCASSNSFRSCEASRRFQWDHWAWKSLGSLGDEALLSCNVLFPKASPMLGFSFSLNFAVGGAALQRRQAGRTGNRGGELPWEGAGRKRTGNREK